jgi:hypothetical protein
MARVRVEGSKFFLFSLSYLLGHYVDKRGVETTGQRMGSCWNVINWSRHSSQRARDCPGGRVRVRASCPPQLVCYHSTEG